MAIMNNSHLYLWSLPIFDCRTLFDLNFKEIIWRYFRRIFLISLFVSICLLFAYTKIHNISTIILISWVITILSMVFYIYLTVKSIKKHNEPKFVFLHAHSHMLCMYEEIPPDSWELSRELIVHPGALNDNILNYLNDTLDRVGKIADVRREEETKAALKILSELNKFYKKSSDIEKIILIKRYYASFLIYLRGRQKEALSVISDIERYYKTLPKKLMNLNDIRAEMARVLVTKATILLALQNITQEEAFKILDNALLEFQSLNLQKEIETIKVVKKRMMSV